MRRIVPVRSSTTPGTDRSVKGTEHAGQPQPGDRGVSVSFEVKPMTASPRSMNRLAPSDSLSQLKRPQIVAFTDHTMYRVMGSFGAGMKGSMKVAVSFSLSVVVHSDAPISTSPLSQAHPGGLTLSTPRVRFTL